MQIGSLIKFQEKDYVVLGFTKWTTDSNEIKLHALATPFNSTYPTPVVLVPLEVQLPEKKDKEEEKKVEESLKQMP